jgi:hypothetical protein
MAAARPERTRLLLVHVLDHVEAGRPRSWPAALRELAALVLVVHGLRAGAS